MVRLYRAPWSTNVERVALALGLKGLAVESVVIDYSDRSLVERVSGQGLVPVIEDAGTVVADSRAILRYLDERYPEPRLFPTDRGTRAQVDLFLEWFDEVWKGPPNEIEAELASPQPDRARIAGLGARMQGWLSLLDRLLAGRDYLVGAELSAADLVAFPFVKYARSRDPRDGELFHRVLDEHQRLLPEHARLAAWVERIDALPRA